MMLCGLESNLGMPLPSGQPQCSRAWLHPLLGTHWKGLTLLRHCPFSLSLLDQDCCGFRTKGLPRDSRQWVEHTEPQQQCKLCKPFYLQDTAGNFKGFSARGRLLGKKAMSRAWLGGGHWEGKNPGCGDLPGEKTEVWVVIWKTESIHGSPGDWPGSQPSSFHRPQETVWLHQDQ